MKRITKLAAALVAAIVCAFAALPALASDTMDLLTSGGAVLQVSSDEGSYTTTFNADGTYTTSAGYDGVWSLDGDQLCFKRSTGESGCARVPDGLGVGDSWDGEVTGTAVTFTIVAA